MDIKWLLKETAVAHRVSVATLIREAGISWSTVHRWQTGKAKPMMSTLQRLDQAAARIRERR